MSITNSGGARTTRHLSLVGDTLHAAARSAHVSRHDLTAQPQRPGELCEVIYLDLEAPMRERLEAGAGKAGIPSQLWLTIAIEAERVLQEVAATTAIAPSALAELLDQAAALQASNAASQAQARLAAYSEALLGARPRAAARRIGRSSVRPALAVAAKWTATAGGAQHLDRWLKDRVVAVQDAPLGWEASAARRGESLGEWVAQAALRSRRSSTLDHTRAV